MGDLVENPLNPGYVKEWPNKAPGLPSKPAYRLPNDPITYAGGRFDSPVQSVLARQPELYVSGPLRGIKCTRTSQHFLSGAIPSNLSEIVRGVTFAFRFIPGANLTNQQSIFGSSLSTLRSRGSTGNGEFAIGATTAAYAGALVSGTYLVTGTSTNITWSRENTSSGTAAGAATQQFVPGSYYLGRDSAGNYLDGTILSMHAWARALSPLEKDFIWKTIYDDGSSGVTTNVYASVTQELQTDITGLNNSQQIDRLRPQLVAPHYFKKASWNNISDTYARVQIAASEDGMVKPDSELIGDDFYLTWVEVPGTGPAPLVFQDAGWSSVFDCRLSVEGHYCARIARNNGGAVFVHFDVEFP
jgi:hypothetical protein